MNVDLFEALMEFAIEKAKKIVYGNREEGTRRWLESSPIDSYDNDQYRVKTFVLEGSPCKGIIVVDYGSRNVKILHGGGYKNNKNIYKHHRDFTKNEKIEFEKFKKQFENNI